MLDGHFATKYKHKYVHLVLPSLLTIALSGCGGGGGDSTLTTLVKPVEPIDLSVYTIDPGTYSQQTVTNTPDAWALGYKGAGITIGFVDSGVNPNHIDFYDDNGYSRINWQDAKGVETTNGYDIELTTNYVDIDTDYHGTHIASIGAGREFGIAPEATILPVNVFFDNNSAYNSAIFAGVEYLVNKAPVINASITEMVNFSTAGGVTSEFNQYRALLNSYDTALITAAGNGGADNIGDPIGADHFSFYDTSRNLSIESVIANQVLHVIALNESGSIASFSNYPGSCSDVITSPDLACTAQTMSDIQNNFISVPGVNIEAAYGATNTDSISYNGTSMATPVVSGGLAVLLSAWDQLTPQQAVSILKDSANNTGIYSDSSIYGVGLMDLNAAMTPLGTLMSAPASVSSPAAVYSLEQTSAVLPSELQSLAALPELQSVALFDKYDRDFLVDLSSTLKIEKQAIDWPALLSQSKPRTQSYQFNDLNITADYSFDSPLGIQSITIQDNLNQFRYDAKSTEGYLNLLLPNNASSFTNLNTFEYGNSVAAKHQWSQNLGLFAHLQTQKPSVNDWPNQQR